jgi:hypothetical protein
LEAKMKKFTITLFVLFLAAGLAYAKDYEVTKKAGDYTVQVKIDRNPPVVGLNKMNVGIKGPKGNDVTDAIVTVEYGMPAMPGMPAMNYKTKTEMKNKQYQTTLNISMSGPWTVNIKITRAGKTQSVKFNVDVG